MINAGDWGLGVRRRMWGVGVGKDEGSKMKGNSCFILHTDVALLRLYFKLHTYLDTSGFEES